MDIINDREIPGVPEDIQDKLRDSTLTVHIDCRNCSAKWIGCHRTCPQMKATVTEEGKAVTGELLKKGRRARVHKDVSVTFGQYMALVSARSED